MKKNYFWGVFLILAGAYLVVSQLGYLPAVGVFSLLFTVVCIAVIVASIPHVHFGGILFPLAFIAIIYDKPLGITANHTVDSFTGSPSIDDWPAPDLWAFSEKNSPSRAL